MTPEKFLIVIFLLMVTTFGSCRKEAVPNTDAPSSIVGVWELTKEYGGFSAEIIFPAGNGNILRFTEETYQIYCDSHLVGSGSYKLLKDTFLVSSVSGSAYSEILDRLCFGEAEQGCHRLKVNDSTFIFNYGAGITEGRERLYTRRETR